MLKKLFWVGALMGTACAITYLVGVYLNNQQREMPSSQQLQQQFDRSIQWLIINEERAISRPNPMLWWMLHQAHQLTGDIRLERLLDRYHQRNQRVSMGLWAPLFGGIPRSYLDGSSVEGLPYYNQHFVYALHCAPAIADDIINVARQNQADFCHQPAYIFRPACITHQLMGINFLFTGRCNLLPEIDNVTQSLQQDIVTQLTWDIRVVDVYLQRVLMLLITGAEESVKPVWIHQVLDHQLADGGWSDFVPVIELPGHRSLGFSSRIAGMGVEKSSFHPTAQGAYILAYLLKSNRSQ